jgi:hypothetical protein
VAEPFYWRPCAIIRERLLAHRHAYDLTAVIGDEQDRIGIFDVTPRPRRLFGARWGPFPSRPVGCNPDGNRGFYILPSTEPYHHFIHANPVASASPS